jgi:ComF family protein
MVYIWSILEPLLGARCHLCGAPGHGLCDPCRDSLPGNAPACPRCATPIPADLPIDTKCPGCQARPPPFDAAIAPLRYAPPVDDLVSGLKYHGRLELAAPLARRLAEAAAARAMPEGGPIALVPVPMADGRLRERGFNQAAELARLVAHELRIPLALDLLQRPGPADPQRGLARSARRGNVRGAFEARGPVPERLALIDDVVTTGATAAQASLALRRAGARWIEVWAVARTPPRGRGRVG